MTAGSGGDGGTPALHLSGVQAGRDLRIEKIRQVITTYNFVESTSDLKTRAADTSIRFGQLFTQLQPFGGRQEELSQLDASVPGGGFIWVHGLAGSGKSALLRSWVNRLAHQDGLIGVCHHWLNRTHGTATREFFLENLCRQLATSHGLDGELPGTVESLQTLLTSLLSIPAPGGRSLVVVIDGLDEALGWNLTADLFPVPLPTGTTIVLAGRDGYFPDRLKPARVIHLGPLSAVEVGDVLAQFDVPSWAQDQQTIAQVRACSQGDPFYVRLLALDIREGLISGPDQLQAQPAGLDAYLAAWWEELTHNVDTDPVEVYDLLGVLCLTKGPIGLEELALVRRGLHRTGQLRTHIRTGRLRRYVVCDEQDQVALFHPRCQQNIAAWLGARELAEYAQDLREFCRRWPENQSVYPLRYYSHHLAEDGSAQELQSLLGPAWLTAHLTRLGHLQHFLSDVELALASLSLNTPADLVDRIQLSVVAAVAAQSTGRSGPLLDTTQFHDPAQVLVGHGPLERALALHRRATLLAKKGEGASALPFALEALKLSERLDSWHIRRNEPGVLSPAPEVAALTVTLTRLGANEHARAAAQLAVRLARAVNVDSQRETILLKVAQQLADANLVDLAISVTEDIPNGAGRSQALHALVEALVRVERYDQARRVTALADGHWRRLPLLIRVLQLLPAETPLRTDVAGQIMTALAADREHWSFGPLLAHCLPAAEVLGGPALVRQTTERALTAVERLENPVEAVWSLAGVIGGVARHRTADGNGAAPMLRQLKDRVDAVEPGMPRLSAQRAWAQALKALALAALAEGDIATALDRARNSQAVLRATSYSAAATPVEYEPAGALEWGRNEDDPLIATLHAAATIDLGTALATVQGWPSGAYRDRALEAVLPAALAAGELGQALDTVDAIQDPSTQAAALSAVADSLWATAPDRAQQLARRVIQITLGSGARWRDTWVMADLAEEVARSGRMEESAAIVEQVRPPEVRAWGYLLLLRAAPPDSTFNDVPRLAELAMVNATAATAPVDPLALMSGRALFTGEDALQVEVRKARQAILPLTRRTMAAGFLLQPPHVADQGDVRTLLLPEVCSRLAQHGRFVEAAAQVRTLLDNPGPSLEASNPDWRTAQTSACLAQLGLVEEAHAAAAHITAAEHALTARTQIASYAERYQQEEQAQWAWAAADETAHALAKLQPRTAHAAGEHVLRYALTAATHGHAQQALQALGGAPADVDILLGNESALIAMTRALLNSGSSDLCEDLLTRARDARDNNPQRTLDVAEAYAITGQPEQAEHLFAEARSQLLNGQDDGRTGRLLLRLAQHHPRGDSAIDPPLADAALRIAAGLPHPFERDDLLVAVAGALGAVGAFSEARAAARLIAGPARRLDALLTQRMTVFETGDRATALEIAREMADVASSVDDADEAAECWALTAVAFAGIQESSPAITSLLNAVETARAVGPAKCFSILGQLLPLISSMDPAQALQRLNASLALVDNWWNENS